MENQNYTATRVTSYGCKKKSKFAPNGGGRVLKIVTHNLVKMMRLSCGSVPTSQLLTGQVWGSTLTGEEKVNNKKTYIHYECPQPHSLAPQLAKHREHVEQADLRRFQMMIRVPVFSVDPGKLIASISVSSSSCVVKGENCRMACRLAFWSSLTESKGEVKDNYSENTAKKEV